MQSGDQPSLFVFTAADRHAREHLQSSISNSIDSKLLRRHLDAEFVESLREQSGGGVYAWGATPGPRNVPTWQRMKPGDYVLAYQARHYIFVARVIAKRDDANFARDLWGTDKSGQTWQYMYFLTRPMEVDVSAESQAHILPAAYQGFAGVSRDRIDRIVSQYGSNGAHRIQGFSLTGCGSCRPRWRCHASGNNAASSGM